jgi:hypothetical protein
MPKKHKQKKEITFKFWRKKLNKINGLIRNLFRSKAKRKKFFRKYLRPGLITLGCASILCLFVYLFWYYALLPSETKGYLSKMQADFNNTESIIKFFESNQDKYLIFSDKEKLTSDEIKAVSAAVTKYRAELIEINKKKPNVGFWADDNLKKFNQLFRTYLNNLSIKVDEYYLVAMFDEKVLPMQTNSTALINKINTQNTTNNTNLATLIQDTTIIQKSLQENRASLSAMRSNCPKILLEDLDYRLQFLDLYITYTQETIKFNNKISEAKSANQMAIYNQGKTDFDTNIKLIIDKEKLLADTINNHDLLLQDQNNQEINILRTSQKDLQNYIKEFKSKYHLK